MKRRCISLLLVGMSLFVTGCPRPGKYARPQPPVPSEWPTADAARPDAARPDAAEAPVPADLGWERFFGDPNLRALIQTALENNRDLRAAALNIEKFRALYRIQGAERRPTVAASANLDAYRVPENLSGNDGAQTVTVYTVGLGTSSWELDFFGRIRSLESQALEQFLASEQARAATQVSLVAAVAYGYLSLAADRENLALARSTLRTQQEALDLIARTRDLGIGNDLDVRQAESQVEAARVEIARFAGQEDLDGNALDLVVGAPVPEDILPSSLEAAARLGEISAGMPSEVLLRRPDILMAEHRLKAAQASIGAARAAFFPRIALTAAGGITSGDLGELFKPGAGTWNFMPQVSLPIFDSGSRRARYDAAGFDRDIAVAEYEKAIQTAFREVSDALSRRGSLLAQQRALESLVRTLEETHRLSEARYESGIDGYLGVLVAQRALYAARQQLVSLRLARWSNLVTLYMVLGGGA